MERGEVMSSAASGSFGTEDDDTPSEEETLSLVEDAILRTLKRHSSQMPEQREQDLRKDGGRLRNAADEERQSAASESSPPGKFDDMELLGSLLEQVHELRRNQRQGSRRPKEATPAEIRKSAKRRGREKKTSTSSEDLRMTLEAATIAAKAAADAAEAAAVSVARNTEAIEFIVNSVTKRRKSKNVVASDEKKAMVRSNQRTHWILGFMAVTTIAWRLGVVKVAKAVSSKLNDPLGYVGGLIGNNEEEKAVEKSAEKGNLLDKLPHIDMPEFLPNASDQETDGDKTKAKETKEVKETKAKETGFFSKSAAAVDVKTKEVEKTAFSFANLLQIKSKET